MNHLMHLYAKLQFSISLLIITIKFLISIIMPNPTTNEIERNIAENNIIKDIRNLFILKKGKRQQH